MPSLTVEGAGGTVQWEVRVPCGTMSEQQPGDREFWYSHGPGSPRGLAAGGACTVPQEDAFRASLEVRFFLPNGDVCKYTFQQVTARGNQGNAFRELEWDSVECR